MTKYKVVKVSVFSYKGKTYTQGDIVDLSQEDVERLTPSDFLEPAKEKMSLQKPLEKTQKKS
jgi:hypothetical protein